jgi:hypothetical protein
MRNPDQEKSHSQKEVVGVDGTVFPPNMISDFLTGENLLSPSIAVGR